MREVSNFHRKNLIETGGAPEFWIAKKATRMIIKKATHKEIFIVPDSFPCDGKRNGVFPFSFISKRLLKNAHLLRFPHPSSLRRTSKYASLLRISGAFHLGIFEQPEKNQFFSNLLMEEGIESISWAKPQRSRIGEISTHVTTGSARI
jgi:hypothetical protein